MCLLNCLPFNPGFVGSINVKVPQRCKAKQQKYLY